MPRNENNFCRMIQRLGHKLLQQDRMNLNVDLFRGSLPTPMPREPRDIFDLILQLILLLLEEWKPDEDEKPDNGETKFPKLAEDTHGLAVDNVEFKILSKTASQLAKSIRQAVENIHREPPSTIRLAREYIRVQNHRALENAEDYYHTWNIAIRNILDNAASDRELVTMDDYLDAWTQIAKGLELIP